MHEGLALKALQPLELQSVLLPDSEIIKDV